jgi:hypothetical protein
MERTLQEFSAELHRILATDPGQEGRKKVCEVVQEMCVDKNFVGKYLTDDAPDRKILYEDPELGFCILGHVNHGAKGSKPHDHGPTWAIYGQAAGETIMTDYALLEPAGEGKRGKVRYVKSYSLMPGMAHVYNEGDLHAPRREGTTKLIRIEGRNLDKIRRFGYELVQ